MIQKKNQSQNRIWLFFGVLAAVVLSLYSIRGAMLSAVALEQEARCGAQEHLHTAVCYENGRLVCRKPVHTHSQNCYLVLLKDNNINRLLSQIDVEETKSLEALIQKTVGGALNYNEDFTVPREEINPEAESTPVTAPEVVMPEIIVTESGAQLLTATVEVPAEQPSLRGVDIAELNEAVAADESAPEIVFNEDLYDAATATTAPTDTTILISSSSAPEAELFAVGGDAQGGNYNANFYIYLDDTWEYFGTTRFEVSGSNRNYTARLDTANMLAFINSELGDEIGGELTQADLDLKSATSASAGSWSWTDATVGSQWTTLGTRLTSTNSARRARYVRLMDGDDPLPFYKVTLRYPDGTEQVAYRPQGTRITLPDGYVWNGNGTEYDGGAGATITEHVTFIAQDLPTDGKVRIVYDVAFPAVSNVTVATEPTLLGLAVQNHTDTVENGASALVRNVSQQEVLGKENGHSAGLSRVIRFRGWQVGTSDVILMANSTLTWEEIQSYAQNGRIQLTALWDYRQTQTASFYIRYDSRAVDTEGNQTSGIVTDYTPELFATHVGGEEARTLSYSEVNEKYYVADTTSDNSYAADQKIRSRYGEQEGIWLQSFPDDDDVFEQLKNYTDQLEVDGEPVAVEDLHSNAYTIRWYVMKCQSDAWHIDGRLVRREGLLRVSKTFAGNAEGVERAKEGFAITARNGDGDKRHTLTLNAGSYLSYDAESDTYIWQIDGIEYGEPWTVTERTYASQTEGETTYSGYAEYSVVDAYDPANNKNGMDEDSDGVLTAEIFGQTYATDEGEVDVLRVDFTNIYHTNDSIIIKKEDAKTGSAIGGATFRLLQNGAALRFNYDAATDRYIYADDGAITELSGSASGYYEIVTTGFSYDNGDITVQEMKPPDGYTPIENILVGELSSGDIGILSDSPLAEYHNGLLIVQNTTESTSVTAVKEWLCPQEEWREVTVQLLANGSVASALIPGIEPSAVLSAANGWSFTWENLPTHANGKEITWALRETKVGTESCKPDFSFANWLVSYGEPVYTRDENGAVTNTRLSVQNDTRRTLLRVVKTGMGGNRLGGASFRLELLSGDGVTPSPDFVVRTMTSDSNGSITFDNLKYGSYRLTEIAAPNGYELLNEPIYLTIHESGQVSVQSHAYASAGNTAYTVQVRNRAMLPLPSTGGHGTDGIYSLGWALIALAVCGYILPRIRKKPGRCRSG